MSEQVRKTAEAVLELPDEEFGNVFFVWHKLDGSPRYEDKLTSSDLKALAQAYLEVDRPSVAELQRYIASGIVKAGRSEKVFVRDKLVELSTALDTILDLYSEDATDGTRG